MKPTLPPYPPAATPARWLKDAAALRSYLAQRDHFLASPGRPARLPPGDPTTHLSEAQAAASGADH